MHWRLYCKVCLLLPSFLLHTFALITKDNHENDPDLFHFVTRPDIKAPKWNLTIYHEDELSEGYWFCAPKQSQRHSIGRNEGWVAPAIYDHYGELIWSGTTQLDSPNVNDFRLQKIGNVTFLTMLDRDRASGVIMDNSYEILQVIPIAEPNRINGHEFQLVEGGKSALVIKNHRQDATQQEKEALGWEGEHCIGNYQQFAELDLENDGKPIFTWSSHGRIGLDESTHVQDPLAVRCNGWDFIHANSVDKTSDGDYLFNARHCDTVYKISKDNGSIIWRLGGKNSDFDLGNITFSREHDIRFRHQNETHTIVSIMDNAHGEDRAKPSYNFSRGLLLSLRTDTKPMTAEIIAHYDHPDVGYAPRRGNMQLLDNGNVFLGWSEHALQSEHSKDGKVLMQAQLKAGWLGSYRNYKFPYVGRPKTKPDVHSVAYLKDKDNKDNPVTRVYVSWNGDTEVRTWDLYHVSAEGKPVTFVGRSNRTGFETSWEYQGYAEYVLSEGFDGDGNVIAEPGVVKTIPHPWDPKERQQRGYAQEIVQHGQLPLGS